MASLVLTIYVAAVCSLATAVVPPIAPPQLSTHFACTICKVAVPEIAKMVENNEPNIEGKLDEVCKAVSALGLDKECVTLINENLESIIKELESGSTADMVCVKVGLCSPPSLTPLTLSLKCSICELALPIIAKMLENNEPNIESKLDEVCKVVSALGLEQECVSLINENLEKIVSELESGTAADQVCAKIGLCSILQETAAVKPVSLSLKCSICELALPIIAKMLENNEPNIESKLDEVCKVVSALGLEKECVSLINENLEKIVSELESGTAADQVCAKIGLCSKLQESVAVHPVSLNGVTCEGCEIIIPFVAKMVEANEPNIEAKLDLVCKFLPSELGSMCKSFINSHLESAVKSLESGVQVEKVCTDIHLC